MTIEDIVRGESKNVEFKATLPKNSEKYVKTIIAFANSQGGQLVVGVDDETRQVVGVDNDEVFHVMDRIANAVSDSCTPQIVPDITFQTIESKTVVVAVVTPGAGRPYFLTSKGKAQGTYIRVAGTSRPADEEKIRELELEGERISWDELTCVSHSVTENAIKKLCRDMNRYRNEMQEKRDSITKLPKVTRTQLVNWGVLKKVDDGYVASNAFALLCGGHFHYAKTQCAVFKGAERGEFVDKREFEGPLYEQIEEAFAFVLRNIHLGAKVEGLVRKERYELPPAAIREMIINAHCHRNFLDNSCVQVALYDDRLEVTSPGSLYFGLTLEEAMSGRSKQRNRVLAEVFNQMGLIEAWGTGLKKITREAKEYDLPEPEFIEMAGTFRVNLYRKKQADVNWPGDGDTSEKRYINIEETQKQYRRNIGEASEKYRRNIGDKLNPTQRQILELLSRDAQLSALKLAEQIGISRRNIEVNIRKLKEHGNLIRHGSPKSGYWEIKE